MKQTQEIQQLVELLKKQAQELEPLEESMQSVIECTAAQIKPMVQSPPDIEDIIKKLNLSDLTLPLLLQIEDERVFLNALYQLVLKRNIDEEGLRSGLENIAKGVSKLQLLSDLLVSQECKALKTQINIDKALELKLITFKTLSKYPLFSKWWNKWLKDQETHLKRQGKIEKQSLQHKEIIEILIEKMAQLEHSIQDWSIIRAELKYTQLNFETRLKSVTQPTQESIAPNTPQEIERDKYDAFYNAFENECRGSLEQIHQQQSIYLPYLAKEAQQPVLDIGCGRGEWLELLQQNNIPAKGVDLNLIMVEICKQKGLQVSCHNALDYLKQQPDNSFSAVTGFHIIEHLPFEILFDIAQQIYRVLTPEGTVIFETPNPENILVGSHTFYHDPTHRNPITPTFIQFLMRYHGFVDAEILRLHPYPEEAKIKGYDPLTERVNGHLCGPQDFAIVTHKPKI